MRGAAREVPAAAVNYRQPRFGVPPHETATVADAPMLHRRALLCLAARRHIFGEFDSAFSSVLDCFPLWYRFRRSGIQSMLRQGTSWCFLGALAQGGKRACGGRETLLLITPPEFA